MINPYSHNADKTKYLHVNTNSYNTNDCDDDDKHAKVMRWASSPIYSPHATVTSSKARQKASQKTEHSFIRYLLICQTLLFVLVMGTVLCLNLVHDTDPVKVKHSSREESEHNLENLAHEIVLLSEDLNKSQQKLQSMEKMETDLTTELQKIVSENRNDRKLRGGNPDKENQERVKKLQEEILKAKAWLLKYSNAEEATN